MNEQKIKRREKTGVILAFLTAILWGMFPVFVNQGTQNIPPITFAALSVFLAAIASFIYIASKGKLKELRKKESYFALFMVTICIVVIPYVLFFMGAKMTSGVNSSMLLLSDIIFTMIFTSFIGEKNTLLKWLGAGGVFFGSLFILYNGNFSLNLGDLLVMISTATHPVGNFYAKKALNYVSGATIVFVRFLFGALFLIIFALVFESGTNYSLIIRDNHLILLFNGIILLALATMVWYECLKKLDISKAITLTMTFPLFSLFILVFFFGESISLYQWIGIIIMMAGVFFAIRRTSVEIEKTKYCS